MAYQALYRKYRPHLFSEVIGQEHITTVLRHQVEEGHVSHAYLFCGSRGTGKTSTAKILSRAVNCLSPVGGEPCGECEACRLSQTDNTDIIELDAASNTGVDDMRSLLDKVHFLPMHLKTKVYIIDEVHMLSGNAFNALLKTLEEPPQHLVFILATTEPRKIPATIISRCQRFDFHRLSVQDITSCLSDALTKSGAKIDDEGLSAIARAADGGMRDAFSLADQCLSFCGNTLKAEDVYSVLGSMEQDFLFELADDLIRSDAGAALRLVDRVIAEGRDVGILVNDLASHFRALLLADSCGSCADLLDCTDDAMRRYLASAKIASKERILRALKMLTEAQSRMKYLPRPRILLESVLVRIAQPENEQSLEAILDRVSRLETARSGGNMPEQNQTLVALSDRVARLEEKLRRGDFTVKQTVPTEKAETRAPAFSNPEPEDEIPLPIPPEEEPISPSAFENTPASAPSDSSAQALWSRFLGILKEENPAAYILVRESDSVSMSGNLLTVCYSKPMRAEVLNRPPNSKVLDAVSEKVMPGLRLKIVSPNEQKTGIEEKARAIFGDKLEIID